MFARRRLFWCKRLAAWQILFCLTVFAFLCRAIIPAGYMPDLSSERKSAFAITLCSMGGNTLLTLDLTGESNAVGEDDHSYHAETCPFGLSVSQELIPALAAPALAGVLVVFAPAFFAPYQAGPSMPALGSPLGARAPPPVITPVPPIHA